MASTLVAQLVDENDIEGALPEHLVGDVPSSALAYAVSGCFLIAMPLSLRSES